MKLNIFNREVVYFIKYILFTKIRFINLLKIKISVFLKLKKVLGFPITVRLEPTNICNLRCPLCPTGQGILKRNKGYLLFKNAKKIIDEMSQYSVHLRLFGAGEPLLNQELFKIIKYAKSKDLLVNFHTNAYFLNESNAGSMVESGLDEVVISLDGASQETYSKYRCGGDFNKVINSLTLLVSKRKDAHKKQPFVIVQFIVMKHNEHEIYLIEEIAKNLGVDRLIITSVRLPDEIDHDFAKNFLPEDSKYSQYLSPAKNEIAFKDIRKICYAPWEEISIAWDGTVYICCYDIIKTSIKQYIYGNVFTGETIKSIWNSKDYILFRKKLLESKNKDEICTNCRGYKPFGDFHLGFFGNKMHDI